MDQRHIYHGCWCDRRRFCYCHTSRDNLRYTLIRCWSPHLRVRCRVARHSVLPAGPCHSRQRRDVERPVVWGWFDRPVRRDLGLLVPVVTCPRTYSPSPSPLVAYGDTRLLSTPNRTRPPTNSSAAVVAAPTRSTRTSSGTCPATTTSTTFLSRLSTGTVP